jgi:hypothetical protein
MERQSRRIRRVSEPPTIAAASPLAWAAMVPGVLEEAATTADPPDQVTRRHRLRELRGGLAWLRLASIGRRVAAAWRIARLLPSPGAPRQPARPARGNL